MLDQQNSYQTGSNELERRLSAAKRDALFIEESKNDKVFRKELNYAIKESTTSMAHIDLKSLCGGETSYTVFEQALN